MELWSIRNPVEIDIINNHGRLVTDAKLVDSDFILAYNWIATELEVRIKKPYKDIRYPVWAWKCWDSERSCKPDLRVRWGHKNEELVLLKLDIPDELLLHSDYQLWHHVLNRWYLPIDEKDQKNFEEVLRKDGINNIWPFPEPYQSQVINSWKRIFCWNELDPSYHGSNLGSSIQTVFWEIKKEWVKEIRYFKSK